VFKVVRMLSNWSSRAWFIGDNSKQATENAGKKMKLIKRVIIDS